MNDFIAARSQMALSLGFHIIFSCIGMVLPFFMAISHYKYLKTKNEIYKGITKAWSKGIAILFATGAVTGTMLSFEMGLLWPNFMKHAGPIFGMPFSLEGTAFFVEAIAIGFFLYGWNRLNPWFHWLTGLLVGVSGLSSGILVVSANAWMNSPSGFDFINGQYVNIDPVKAMFNAAWFSQALHMCLAAFVATGFAIAGLHAYLLLKGKNIEFHAKAFKIAAICASVAALLQPISGDISARDVAGRQPEKFAAMEAHFKTEKNAPLLIGGIVNEQNQTVDHAIKIPGMLSFMTHGDAQSEVKGLNEFYKNDRPPVAIVRYSFQIMIFLGVLLMVLGVVYLLCVSMKKSVSPKKWLLKAFVVATPLGYLALEAGWIVTEVGRQPWIMYKFMRTSEAVTPMPGIQYSFYLFTVIFISLGLIVGYLIYRQVKMVPKLYDVKDENYNPNPNKK